MNAASAVTRWRHKIDLRKAYDAFTGGSSVYMRGVKGNYPKHVFGFLPKGVTQANANKNLEKKHNLLRNYIVSKKIHTPTLYKGLSGKDAKEFLAQINLKERGFLKEAAFHTKSITSTSTNRFQASAFARNGVLLVIPRAKRYAMIAGHYGIKSRQPREKEVTLPPGKFVFRYRNSNTGNYHVDFVPHRH